MTPFREMDRRPFSRKVVSVRSEGILFSGFLGVFPYKLARREQRFPVDLHLPDFRDVFFSFVLAPPFTLVRESPVIFSDFFERVFSLLESTPMSMVFPKPPHIYLDWEGITPYYIMDEDFLCIRPPVPALSFH